MLGQVSLSACVVGLRQGTRSPSCSRYHQGKPMYDEQVPVLVVGSGPLAAVSGTPGHAVDLMS